MSAKCKTCGAEIVWVVTPAGAKAPCDAKPKKVWCLTGRLICGANEAKLVTAYESHFATCPQADQHRRKP